MDAGRNENRSSAMIIEPGLSGSCCPVTVLGSRKRAHPNVASPKASFVLSGLVTMEKIQFRLHS